MILFCLKLRLYTKKDAIVALFNCLLIHGTGKCSIIFLQKFYKSNQVSKRRKFTMGIFGGSTNAFDPMIEKVTDEKNTGEDWGEIMSVCDRVGATANGPKECLKALIRRLNNKAIMMLLIYFI